MIQWLPSGQTQDNVIHRPDLRATAKINGKVLEGTGYSKRYYGLYPRFWGYRFYHGVTTDVVDGASHFWTADAAFGDNKYNYWKVLGPEDGAALAHVISKNKTCITLDLFVNEIFEEAGVAVGKALASNMVLKSLDLQQAQVGVPGAKAIAAALKANIPLMNLKMHYNHLGPEGVGAIAEALKTNDKLTNLDLGDNGMMKEGVQALAAMLQKNTKLMRLDCSKNAGLWGDDAMKGVLTKAGEQHDAARKKAKKLIPQDELPFKLLMEDSPGQMWSPNGFVNVVHSLPVEQIDRKSVV